MKKHFLFIVFCLASLFALAQKNPVTFNYEAKKKADNTYDIIITATIEKSWHLYSQNTEKGGPIPTKITFKANPLITLVDKVKENGKLEKKYDDLFKVNVLYYSNKVLFVQNVKLKANAKTNISGTIEYMVCNDSECLPTKKLTFDIKL